MKFRKILCILTFLILLTGCGPIFSSYSSSSTSSVSTTSSSLSSTNSSVNNKTLTIYAINDFHGAVKEAGIVRIGSYLKEKKQSEDALLINSGDYWQGSIESNHNRGKLLTDVSNYVQFDCLTLGNHEFDWGQKYIRENRSRKDEESLYQTPFLAANIYRYDLATKTIGEYADLGEKYVIRELNNGLKVGIIGVIGSNLTASITSTHVDDLIFVDPVNTIKELSDELRVQKSCDVIIASCHCDEDDISEELTLKSSVSNRRYVDAVFCGHSHQDEYKVVNDVPYIQTNGYGSSISYIKLEEKSDNSFQTINCYNIVPEDLIVNEDVKLKTLVKNYTDVSDSLASEVLCTFSGGFHYLEQLPNLVCTALAYYAVKNDISVDYTMVNRSRCSLANRSITYGDLYRALPFDNEVQIVEVLGQDLLNCARSNNIYRFNPEAINKSKVYKIAVIDYLSTHRNSNREYDNFPNLKIIGTFTKEGEDLYNYRDITADFLRNFKDETLDSSSFNSDSDYYNVNNLEKSVVLPSNPYLS